MHEGANGSTPPATAPAAPAPTPEELRAAADANATAVEVILSTLDDVLAEVRATRGELHELRVEVVAARPAPAAAAPAAAAAAAAAPAGVAPALRDRVVAMQAKLAELRNIGLNLGLGGTTAPTLPPGTALVPERLVPFIRGCATHAGVGLTQGCAECLAAVEPAWAAFVRAQ